MIQTSGTADTSAPIPKDIDALPLVSGANDWLDLAIGQPAVLRARLESITVDGPEPGLLFSFPDWDQLVLSIEDDGIPPNIDAQRAFVGKRVQVIMFRTEDGPGLRHSDILTMSCLDDA